MHREHQTVQRPQRTEVQATDPEKHNVSKLQPLSIWQFRSGRRRKMSNTERRWYCLKEAKTWKKGCSDIIRHYQTLWLVHKRADRWDGSVGHDRRMSTDFYEFLFSKHLLHQLSELLIPPALFLCSDSGVMTALPFTSALMICSHPLLKHWV